MPEATRPPRIIVMIKLKTVKSSELFYSEASGAPCCF